MALSFFFFVLLSTFLSLAAEATSHRDAHIVSSLLFLGLRARVIWNVPKEKKKKKKKKTTNNCKLGF